jgi:single-strand DNA-binding protein
MINNVVLVGRLTRDPELRYTTNNIANLRFTVAVNRQFSNQNGERQADFINCVAWRAQAENMARFLKKGALIGVSGRIETGRYTAADGNERFTTDVIADNVQFLEPRGAAGGGQPSAPSQPAGFGGNTGFNGGGNDSFGGGFPSAQASNPAPQQSFGAPYGGASGGMNSNPFPSNNSGANAMPDFNNTIDISDDDLPF